MWQQFVRPVWQRLFVMRGSMDLFANVMMKNVRMLLLACGYAWLRARSACEVPGCIEYVLENVVCV